MDPTPTPTVLLYDWDNTLVDGWVSITGALNAVFTSFSMPLWTNEDTRSRVRTSLRDSFPPMFGAEWERARDLFYATLTERHLHDLQVLPGMLDVLQAGAPWPQGVVSNKAGSFLRREVTHLGWDAHFSAVIGAGDAAADKPAPDSILLALSRMGHPANTSVWYVGDTASDMQAAKAAGVTAVLVGDASHDGGVDNAAPDLHMPTGGTLAARLRLLV